MKLTFPLALFLLFLGLKLGGLITWSWWLVTAPLWVGVLLIPFIMLAAFIWAVLVGLGSRYR